MADKPRIINEHGEGPTVIMPADAINRCWVSIDTPAMQEPEVRGPMSYEEAWRIMADVASDDSINATLIDADDTNITIPGSVARGDAGAPYYSTLRSLLTYARNVALQGGGVFDGHDDKVRDNLMHIATQIEQTLAPIR